jgi:2-haloacid dehalogenase
MSVLEQVQSDVNDALKGGDRERVHALRLIASELQKAAKEGALQGDLSEDTLREYEVAVLQRERKRRVEAAEAYREVLRDSLSEWAGERGYRWNDHDGEALVHAMESWQPFPDTVPALRQAKQAGLRLCIVSNTDRAIMAHTLRQLDVDFDEAVVAEDVRAYKPALGPFARALEATGEDPDRILHVAFGFKYDIGPAMRLGMRTAWVNRKREPRPGPDEPDFEWDDLWPLAGVAG